MQLIWVKNYTKKQCLSNFFIYYFTILGIRVIILVLARFKLFVVLTIESFARNKSRTLHERKNWTTYTEAAPPASSKVQNKLWPWNIREKEMNIFNMKMNIIHSLTFGNTLVQKIWYIHSPVQRQGWTIEHWKVYGNRCSHDFDLLHVLKEISKKQSRAFKDGSLHF